MKIRKFTIFTVLCLALISTVSTVMGQGQFRSPTKDTACDPLDCSDNLNLITQTGQDINGNCTVPNLVSYVGWNLSGVADSIGSASLTLTTTTDGLGTEPGTYDFTLVEPTNHAWTVNGSNPGFGAEIDSVTGVVITGADGQQVTFTSDALGAYFEGLRIGADPTNATIGIVLTGGCAPVGGSIVSFEDEEVGFVDAGEPDLIFFPGPGATAVSLSETGAASDGLNPSVLFGGAALLVATAWALLSLRNRKSTEQM